VDLKEEIIKLVKDYYGESRDDGHIEEVADLIDSNISDIASIHEKWLNEEEASCQIYSPT
jgi:hypothetical protein